MAKSLVKSPAPVPRLIPSVVNADPAVLARESTAHADAILRQGDQTAAAQATAASASTTATAARGAAFKNVQIDFGAVGDGVADDTAALQAAIDGSAGRRLYWPAGEYKILRTLQISQRSNHWIGDFANRAAQNGTQLSFYGTGPCVQIGNDNGHSWDANEYDGPQDQIFEDMWIRHAAPDTAMGSFPGGANIYKAGAYGIWDWRGGAIVLRNIGLEQFEANFVGIQSDINSFLNIVSLYSKFGLYIGPRSDQCSIHQLLSFNCDRAVTIDRAAQTRIVDAQLVGCGIATTGAIEVRKGSSATVIARCWFEHLAGTGYAGVDQLSFVSVGEIAGYGPGGSIVSAGPTPTLISVEGCDITDPFLYTELTGNPGHTRFGVSVDMCHRLSVVSPSVIANTSLTNLDAIVGIQLGHSPSNADTQIAVRDVTSSLTLAHIFTNLGAGAPSLTLESSGPSGRQVTIDNRFFFGTFGDPAGADLIRMSQEGQPGEVWFTTPNKPTGQTIRFRCARSIQPGNAAAAPTTGTWERGDIQLNIDPSPGGFIGWVCTTGGTPGTWKSWGPISP